MSEARNGSCGASAPLVSAVIPSYNYGHFVCEAVESALAQTYPNIEVVVVDDGSTDDTRERLAPYTDRIRYIHQTNSGLSAARNTGIRHARGEWIALLDADDLWHPDKTTLQLASAKRVGRVALIGSPPARAMPKELPLHPPLHRVGVSDFLLSSRMGPSSALIRRDAFSVVGNFDETLRSVEDRDMWLRLAAQYPAVVVESPCWSYRTHSGQMSRAAKRMYDNYHKVLESFFENHPDHAMLRNMAYSYLYFDSSLCFLECGERWRALGMLLRSFADHLNPLPDTWRPYLFRFKLMVRILLGDQLFHWLHRLLKVRLDDQLEPLPPPIKKVEEAEKAEPALAGEQQAVGQ
jgi:glycosyltransferase involved in cell wall biosynthesis